MTMLKTMSSVCYKSQIQNTQTLVAKFLTIITYRTYSIHDMAHCRAGPIPDFTDSSSTKYCS